MAAGEQCGRLNYRLSRAGTVFRAQWGREGGRETGFSHASCLSGGENCFCSHNSHNTSPPAASRRACLRGAHVKTRLILSAAALLLLRRVKQSDSSSSVIKRCTLRFWMTVFGPRLRYGSLRLLFCCCCFFKYTEQKKNIFSTVFTACR